MVERKFSSETKSIRELFRSHTNFKFKIPPYQRDYSWKSKEIHQLWRDLINSFEYVKTNPTDDNQRKAQYFFGPVVVIEAESEQYLIIDGQQRFTTLALLLCAARDILDDLKLRPDIYHEIKNILERKNTNHDAPWKLELNDTDKDLFKRIMDGDGNKITKNDHETVSQKRLHQCYTILRKNIDEQLEIRFGMNKLPVSNSNSNNLKDTVSLSTFVGHVLDSNYVTELSVRNDGNPYQIFEALNGRGQKLTDTNRIKNHILEEVSHDTNKAQILNERWNAIFNKIVTKGLTTDQFIVESFQSRYPNTKLKSAKPYSIIKNKVRDLSNTSSITTSGSIGCDQYVKELEEDAEFLLNLTNARVSNSIRHDAEAISLLGAKYIRVPLLAAYRAWKTKDYEQLLHLLVKFFFKKKTIRGEHSGRIATLMLTATRNINAGYSLNEVTEKIKHFDNHKLFLNKFEEYVQKPTKPSVAKYILHSIDLYLAKRNQRYDYVHDHMIGQRSLERVLPSKNSQWDKDEFFRDSEYDDEMDDYVNSLGNMTLLTKPLNSTVKNMTFSTKRNHYELSDLEITRQTVCNYDEWTANVIEERERDFIKYADDIWRIA